MRPLRTLLFLALASPVLLAQEPPKPPIAARSAPLPAGAVARLGSLGFAVPGPSPLNTVAISPDGKWIAASGTAITIWNVETTDLSHTLTGSEGMFPGALTWSANGKLLASMNQRQVYRIWDVAKGEASGRAGSRKIAGLDRLTDFRFVAGDKLLALVLNDRRVELGDVANGTLSHVIDMDRDKRDRLKAIGDGYELRHVAFSPTGNRLAWLAAQPDGAANGKSAVLVYEADTEKLLHAARDLPHAANLMLPDEGETVVLFPAVPKKRETAMTLTASVVEIPTGKVCFAFDNRLAPSSYESGLATFEEEVERVTVTRWGYRFRDALVIRDGLGFVRWDWTTGRELGRYQIRKGDITDDAGREYDHEWFAADGSVFGYLTWDFRLTLVHCDKGTTQTIGVSRLFTRQRWHYRSVGSDRKIFAYNADYSDLSRDRPAGFELWDREGHLLRRFLALVPNEMHEDSLLVSPDGRTLLAPNKGHTQIEFYETATGKKRGHVPSEHSTLR